MYNIEGFFRGNVRGGDFFDVFAAIPQREVGPVAKLDLGNHLVAVLLPLESEGDDYSSENWRNYRLMTIKLQHIIK